jgi:acyl-lipid omega-6 desaturase (Delta-12 desaturase)
MENIKIDPAVLKGFNKYTKTDGFLAVSQIINSFGPFVGLWILMYWAYDYSYWFTFLLGILNAFFLVRIFIIQHDCGHRSFIANTKMRNVVGYLCSIFSTIPYHYWSKSHHIHHSHNGQLEVRDIGDINTLTVNEYRALSAWGKIQYRIYRSYLVMFVIGPIYYVVVHNRIQGIDMDIFKNEKWKLYINNIVLTIIFCTLGYFLGWAKFL